VANTPDRTELFYQQGNSDKVYHVILRPDGASWVVEAEYGRRGGSLIQTTKTARPTNWLSAKSVFDQVVLEKLAKGYQWAFSKDLDRLAQQATEVEQQRQALSWLMRGTS
jgi:hypothetical protein